MRELGAVGPPRPRILSHLIEMLVLALFLSPVSPVPFARDNPSSPARSPDSEEQPFLSSPTLVRLSLISVLLIVLCRLIAHGLDLASERRPHNLCLLYAQIAFLIASYHICVPVGLALSVLGIVNASLESGLAGVSVLAAIYFANYSSWSSCSRLCQLWCRIPDPAWLSEVGRKQLSRTVKALIRLAMDEDSSTDLLFHERVEMAMLYLKFTEIIVTVESAANDDTGDGEQSPCSPSRSFAALGNVLDGAEGTWICEWAKRFGSPSQSPRDNSESVQNRESPTSVTSPDAYASGFTLPIAIRDAHQHSHHCTCAQNRPIGVASAESHKMEEPLSAEDTSRSVVAVLNWIRPVQFSYEDRCQSYECYQWVMRQSTKDLLSPSKSRKLGSSASDAFSQPTVPSELPHISVQNGSLKTRM